jgi:type IV pilus assembly protein PilA
MALKKNDKGLTLIELLITIAVIAIVAAISVPVITNVSADSRTNSASAMQEQAQAFIDKYEASGEWSFDTASQTFLGGIDEDGNGTVALGSVASPGAEVIDTLAVDAGQFTATVAGTTATVVAAGGTNNAGGAPAFDVTGKSLNLQGIPNTQNSEWNGGPGQGDGIDIASSWSASTPVLVTYSSDWTNGVYYAFLTVSDAEFSIDYYDLSGFSEVDLVYSTFNTNGANGDGITTFTHYTANPLAGPANKLPINWQNVVPSGGGK